MRKKDLQRGIAHLRLELQALELDAKAASKNTDCTPEEHLQRAIRAGNLRNELRTLEAEMRKR